MDAERDGARKKKVAVEERIVTHPQGTQSASLSACQTFMNIPFVMGEA